MYISMHGVAVLNWDVGAVDDRAHWEPLLDFNDLLDGLTCNPVSRGGTGVGSYNNPSLEPEC